MINYFPISRATFANSQRLSIPPPAPPAENITIERLRLENESLKKQLSDLLKVILLKCRLSLVKVILLKSVKRQS
jgi:hypothetical protein